MTKQEIYNEWKKTFDVVKTAKHFGISKRNVKEVIREVSQQNLRHQKRIKENKQKIKTYFIQEVADENRNIEQGIDFNIENEIKDFDVKAWLNTIQ